MSDILNKERQFINLLLKDLDLVSIYIESNLTSSHFHQENSLILKAIEDFYAKGVLLTKNSFEDFVKKYNGSIQERINQEKIFSQCCITVAKKDEYPYLMDSIYEDYLLRKSGEVIESFKSDISKKGVLSSFKNFVDKIDSIEDDSINNSRKTYYEEISSLCIDHFEYLEKIRKKEIDVPPRVLTGLNELDEVMGSGLAPGTLSLVISDVGGFKSSVMMNIALNVWSKGYNVLFIPIEMAKEQVFERIWSRQAKVPQEKIQRKIYSDEESLKIKEEIKKFNNSEYKFFIMEEQGNTSVSSIKRQIDKHLDIFKPQLVVVDYIDNLESDRKRGERYDLEISDMLQSLRKSGRDKGFGVVSGAQIGRDALRRIRKAGATKEGASINSEDIRGAHSFATDADFIWAQIPNSAQPGSLIDIYIVKNRTGPKMFKNGTFKSSLEINPDIQLIRSLEEFDMSEDGISKRLNAFDDDLDFLGDDIVNSEEEIDSIITKEEKNTIDNEEWLNDLLEE